MMTFSQAVGATLASVPEGADRGTIAQHVRRNIECSRRSLVEPVVYEAELELYLRAKGVAS